MTTLPKIGSRNRKTLETIAMQILEHLPLTVMPADQKFGRKVVFQMPMKKEPKNELTDFIYLFVESILPDEPADQAVGYSEQDVVNTSGIHVFTQKKSGMTVGQSFPLSILLNNIITDFSLRNRVLQRINEMKQLVTLDEDFIEAINRIWRLAEKGTLH